MTLQFVTTPRDLAVFDTTLAQAATVLGCEEAAVETLGLPQVEGRFDFTDVVNAGLHSGKGTSVPEIARGLLMRFASAEPESWFASLDWTVSVQWPRSGARFRVAVPDLAVDGIEIGEPDLDVAAPAVRRGHQAEPYQVRVRLTGEKFTIADRRVRAAYGEVLAAFESGAVHYQAVSEPLRIDHRRAWAMGLGDCVVAARVLADRLRAEGLEARARRSFLLGIVPNDHGYCEVLLDGRWRCLDPIFALLAAKYAGNHTAEFRDACVGSRFNRLLPCAVDGSAPLFLRHDGTPAPTWAFSVSSRLHRQVAAAPVTDMRPRQPAAPMVGR